ELAGLLRLADPPLDQLQPAVERLRELLPHRPGMRVELGGRRREEAPAGEDGTLEVAEEVVAERLEPGEGGRRLARRPDHRLREDLGGRVDRGELQLLLRTEVRIEPALRHP